MDRNFKVLLLPTGDLYDELFPRPVLERLASFAEIKTTDVARLDREGLIELAHDVDGAITSWGSPKFDAEVVAQCPQLRFIGHAAGSIKPIVTPEVFQKGVTVSGSAAIIAKFVGEACLMSAIAGLRKLTRNDRAMRDGEWKDGDYHIHDSLYGQVVGLVGLGMTARSFLQLLQPFQCQVLAYDPFISPDEAAKLGVTVCELDELLQRSGVISLHAAALPETNHMISAEKLALISDGALLINTARGALIDEVALIGELQSGRISAVLDVYEKEPLAADSPLRKLENVILTPHVAGPAYKRRWEMALAMVRDCERVLTGQKAMHSVDGSKLSQMA